MASQQVKNPLRDHYGKLFLDHGPTPAGVQGSAEGMLGRFEQICKISDFSKQSVLDIGCGYGALYPFIQERFHDVRYKGIDIVQESVEWARQNHPEANWECRNLIESPLTEHFDWVLICGVFNNGVPDPTGFLKKLTATAWEITDKGLAFNFISTHVNVVHEGMAYHDPLDIFDFCRSQFSNKVSMAHHYFRCDVSMFVYR